jgi:F0F1-type ATP synthase assembly protein I
MEKKDDEVWRSLAGAGESVLAIGVLAGVGAWGGCLLDQRFHCTPWCAIVLSLLGLSLGLARMVMKALQSEKK